jgi:hypothetical protein
VSLVDDLLCKLGELNQFYPPMNTRLVPALLFASILGAAFAARCLGAGLVIYKDYSFDSDSQAEMAEYATDDHYSNVDNVVTPSGGRLRILASQEAIFIPAAGEHGKSPAAMTQAIAATEKRFPQFQVKLEGYRREWAAAPVPTPAPTPEAAISPENVAAAAEAVASADAPPPAPNHGTLNNVLHTKSGESLKAWTVTGMEGDDVVISHAAGISRVPIVDLPDNLYGFPEAVIDRAEQLRQARLAGAAKGTQGAQPLALAKASPGRMLGVKPPGRHGPHPHKSPSPPPNWAGY